MLRINLNRETDQMAKRIEANNDLVHSRTGAAKTTTPEMASPSRVAPPTPAEVIARQKADADRARQPAALAKNVPAVVPEPTPEERAQLIAANIAKLGGRGAAASVTFNGNDGAYVRSDSANLPADTHVIVGVPNYRAGFCNFKNSSYEEEMRGVDEVQVERDDLPGGWDEEPGMDGTPRLVWQEQQTVPVILTTGGHEILTFTARNGVSRIALEGLVANVYAHPLFKRGLWPIVSMGVGFYVNKKLGGIKKPKPILRIVGWCNTDGSAADVRLAAPPQDRITSGKSLSAEMNDEIGM
jgi:hypothetical protein